MELALLQGNALAFIFRWIHLLAGIAWIGLLWYFNFVQAEYFKKAEASSKSDAIRKLVPRALWWFRWGAMFTFISGIALLGAKHLTGYGIIINTSFNVRGEPIVCTPEDAYRCFMRTEMDCLVLGSYILRKTEQPAWADKGEWQEEFTLD